MQAGLLCSSMQGMAACPVPGVGMGAVAWLWRGPAVSQGRGRVLCWGWEARLACGRHCARAASDGGAAGM